MLGRYLLKGLAGVRQCKSGHNACDAEPAKQRHGTVWPSQASYAIPDGVSDRRRTDMAKAFAARSRKRPLQGSALLVVAVLEQIGADRFREGRVSIRSDTNSPAFRRNVSNRSRSLAHRRCRHARGSRARHPHRWVQQPIGMIKAKLTLIMLRKRRGFYKGMYYLPLGQPGKSNVAQSIRYKKRKLYDHCPRTRQPTGYRVDNG